MKNKNTPLADEYLKITEGLPAQETDAFFYTRLKARMENSLEKKYGWNFSLRPSLLVGALTMLLFVNGIFFVTEQKSQPVSTKQPVSTNSELQTFASSYDLTISTPY